jgi:hypothetical protein
MKGIFLTIMFLITSAGLNAKANVCITDVYGENLSLEQDGINYNDDGKIYLASLTCRELNNINNGVQAVAIGFSAVGIYAACTGVGLPATVALEGGALALSGISLIVTNLDCDDTESELKIKEKVDEAVCLSLEAQGLTCIPPLTKTNNDIFSI